MIAVTARRPAVRPEVPATADVLVHAAGVGLEGRTSSPVTLADVTATRVVDEAARRRLTGHLVAAIGAGTVVASADGRARAMAAHRRAVRHVLRVEQVLLETVDVLAAAGVGSRVLKGPAVARTLYPCPAVRTFVDVDLLVRSGDIDRAAAALRAAGHRRPVPELRPGFDRRFGKTAMFVHPAGIQVDLHRTLVVGPHGLLIDLADLFAGGRSVTVGGRGVATLDVASEFLALCYHAALGDVPPRLASLRDVAQALARHPDILAAVLDQAEAWRGRAVVARAVSLAASVFDLVETPSIAWAAAYRPDRGERRLLSCYVAARHGNARKYLASARVIRGPVDKAAFLAALLFPRREVLTAHGRHRGPWLRQGVRSLLRRTAADADAPAVS